MAAAIANPILRLGQQQPHFVGDARRGLGRRGSVTATQQAYAALAGEDHLSWLTRHPDLYVPPAGAVKVRRSCTSRTRLAANLAIGCREGARARDLLN